MPCFWVLRLNSISYKYCVKFPDKIKQCLTQSPANAIGTTSNILLNRQHILMFATTLTIPGEQKVSMNKRNPLVSQLLLLPAYILEWAMVSTFPSIQFLRLAFCLSLSVVQDLALLVWNAALKYFSYPEGINILTFQNLLMCCIVLFWQWWLLNLSMLQEVKMTANRKD